MTKINRSGYISDSMVSLLLVFIAIACLVLYLFIHYSSEGEAKKELAAVHGQACVEVYHAVTGVDYADMSNAYTARSLGGFCKTGELDSLAKALASKNQSEAESMAIISAGINADIWSGRR